MSQRIYIGNWDVSNSMRLDGDFVYSPFPVPFQVELLVVGGGGGGGQQYTEFLPYNRGGGGGAGGMVTGSLLVSLNDVWNVTIGGAGLGGDTYRQSTNGNNSTFVSSSYQVTAYGGGRGANPRYAGSNKDGGSGGSGGGAGTMSGGLGSAGLETQGTSNIGTFSYFGEQGGTGQYCGTGQLYTGGGGGGAGSPGSQSSCNPVGGNGLIWVDGVTYAKGGGHSTQAAPIANTGNGGKAQDWTETNNAGNGASGVVKLRYRGLVKATGGTITQADGYTYHTFTSNDTFTVISSVDT